MTELNVNEICSTDKCTLDTIAERYIYLHIAIYEVESQMYHYVQHCYVTDGVLWLWLWACLRVLQCSVRVTPHLSDAQRSQDGTISLPPTMVRVKCMWHVGDVLVANIHTHRRSRGCRLVFVSSELQIDRFYSFFSRKGFWWHIKHTNVFLMSAPTL